MESTALPAEESPWRYPSVQAAVGFAAIASLVYCGLARPPFDVDGYLYWGEHLESYWRAGELQVHRTPGFPVFIALVEALGGGPWSIQMIQCATLAAGAGFTAVLAARVGGRRAASVAAWLYATYLPLLSYVGSLLTEAVSIPLLLAATGLVSRGDATRSSTTRRWLGWLLALAVWIRPAMGVPCALLGVVYVIGREPHERSRLQRWRAAGRRAASLVVPALVLFGPFIGRNLATIGRASPLGNVTQLNVAYGIHLPYDDELGQWSAYHRDLRFFGGSRPDGFTQEKARALDLEGTVVDNLTRQPMATLRSRMIAQLQLWGWPVTARIEEGEPERIPYRLLHTQHLALLAGGLAGWWQGRSVFAVRVMALLGVATAALHLGFHATPRFALPVMPLLMAGAASWRRPRVLHGLISSSQLTCRLQEGSPRS